MNEREKYLNRQKTLDYVKKSSLSGTQVGRAKCWKNTTYKHWMTICSIVWKLVKDGYSVYTETEFINGTRADIFYIDHNGDGGIVEVLNTETNERFNIKLEKYPFHITKVRVDEYNEDDWCL